jgi:hypothetical protein
VSGYYRASIRDKALRALASPNNVAPKQALTLLWDIVPENLHGLNQLLYFQRLLQNCDRTDLKNSVKDLAVRIPCDNDNIKIRINLLGCLKDLITGSVWQL